MVNLLKTAKKFVDERFAGCNARAFTAVATAIFITDPQKKEA